jgi:hypothetical protein
MNRRLYQFAALVITLVSVVNAECALSCSLLMNKSSLVSSQAGHACCPHHGPSDSDKPSHDPCGYKHVPIDRAQVARSSAVGIVMPVVAEGTLWSVLPSPQIQYSELRLSPAGRPDRILLTTAVLRL